MSAGTNSPLDEGVSRPRMWVAWLETLVVSSSTLLIGFWFNPTDPFFINSVFCWILLAPLLAGLRYGFALGFTSAGVLSLALTAAWAYGMLPVALFPAELGIGLLAVGMIAGEFSDMWTRRLRRSAAVSEYRRTRLDEFARGYHLLKVSHDQLERKIAGTTQNMREALTTVRKELQTSADRDDPLFGLGKRVIGIFSSYGWVQIASLFAVDRGEVAATPLATLGDQPPDNAADIMLQESALNGKLVAVRGGSGETGDSDLVAAIPLVDVQNRVWAVVAVRQMLFIAFHWENLKLLAVLAGHMADLLAAGARIYEGQSPRAVEFRDHLSRSIRDAKEYDLAAAVVALVFRSSRMSEFLARQIADQRRGLDRALLLRSRTGDSVVMVLLPLTNELGVEGYLARVERSIRERYGTSLKETGITSHRRLLDRRSRLGNVFVDLCSVCDVDEASLAETAA